MITRNRIKSKLFVIFIVIMCTLGFSPVHAGPSESVQLIDVTFSEGYLSKYEFTPSRTWYQLTVPTGIDNIEVTAVAKNSSAEIDIGGNKNMVKTGSKKIVITVTNGSNKAFYTFELVFSDKAVTTVTTTTTTQTTTSVTTSETEQVTDVSREESSLSQSTIDETSAKLSYLGIKGEKFSKSFSENIYEYTAIVDSLENDYTIETITVSPNANVNITRNENRYLVEVTNGDNKKTYIIKLNLKNTISDDTSKESNFMVIRNGIIGIVLLILAILLFLLSRKLSKE